MQKSYIDDFSDDIDMLTIDDDDFSDSVDQPSGMEFCIRWISLSKKGELFPPTWKKWFDQFRNQFDLYSIKVSLVWMF